MKKEIANLEDLLVLKIRVLYDIESEVIKALPGMIRGAKNEELCDLFRHHLEESKEHTRRLKDIFNLFSIKATKERSESVRGIAADGRWVVKNIKDRAARDSAIISSASSMEHFEMAAYMIAKEWATMLGRTHEAEILDTTLKEEIEMARKLLSLGVKLNGLAMVIEEEED